MNITFIRCNNMIFIRSVEADMMRRTVSCGVHSFCSRGGHLVRRAEYFSRFFAPNSMALVTGTANFVVMLSVVLASLDVATVRKRNNRIATSRCCSLVHTHKTCNRSE